VLPSFFINHVYTYGDQHRDIFLGPERAANIDPLAWAEERNLPFGLHSDAPVTEPNPLRSIWTCATRKTQSGKVLGAHQRISVLSALRAYTIGNAYLGHDDERIGTLDVGKMCDLAILSESPLDVADVDDIPNIVVRGVVLGGNLMWK
jgi:predicted amidohydrolase YtcJ